MALIPSNPPSSEPVIPLPKGLPREMVSNYLANCRKDLSQLRVALATSDYPLARRLGHQMKGTGNPFGFPGLTEIGIAIERAAAAPAAAELEIQLQRLETYLSSVEIT